MADAERRRFWTPKALRIWAGLVLVLEGWLFLASFLINRALLSVADRELVIAICYHGLSHLSVWMGGWIGADLLSCHRPDNVDPQRDPHPSELFAHLIGRLIPFSIGYLILVLTFVCACAVGALESELLSQLLADTLSERTTEERFTAWAGWSLVPCLAGVAFALLAAMISGLFRRPRRLLVLLTAVVPGTVLLATLTLLIIRLNGFAIGIGEFIASDSGVLATSLAVNPTSVALFWDYFARPPTMFSGDNTWTPPEWVLKVPFHAALYFVAVAGGCALAALWMATMRYRRTSYNREAWEQSR